MSKSKSSSKGSKPSKESVLTKVKDAAIVKPAQQAKAKSKEIAKVLAGKEDKKSGKSKKVREPTPESSDESDDAESSASSESSSSESESEAEVPTKATTNGKANGSVKVAKKADSDDSESDADSSDNDTLVNTGKAKATSAADSDASDSDDSAGSSDDDEPAPKATAKSAKESDDDSADSSDGDSSDDSSSSEDEAADVKRTTAAKRKAEEITETVAKKTKTANGDTPQSGNLFVGSLSWNVDDGWLRETFEEFGEISRAVVMTDRATGRSKGFGYVEFVNAEDAVKAHSEKQGFELDGRPINIDFANARPNNQDRQDNRRKSYGDSMSEPSDTLFLGNLSFDVGQEAVTEAFSPHGTILGVRLPTDRETGQPKGYGYVTFASIDEATAALEAMQGGYISNRPVRLDYSQPRPQNGDSRGGRGGFGGRGGGGRGAGRGGRGGRGGFGGFGGGGFGGGRGGRGGAPRTNTTNRGGFGDFAGSKVSFD